MSTNISTVATARRTGSRRVAFAAAATGVVAAAAIAVSLSPQTPLHDTSVASDAPAEPAAAASDPWILWHHRLDTAAESRSPQDLAAERFHHR